MAFTSRGDENSNCVGSDRDDVSSCCGLLPRPPSARVLDSLSVSMTDA